MTFCGDVDVVEAPCPPCGQTRSNNHTPYPYCPCQFPLGGWGVRSALTVNFRSP